MSKAKGKSKANEIHETQRASEGRHTLEGTMKELQGIQACTHTTRWNPPWSVKVSSQVAPIPRSVVF